MTVKSEDTKIKTELMIEADVDDINFINTNPQSNHAQVRNPSNNLAAKANNNNISCDLNKHLNNLIESSMNNESYAVVDVKDEDGSYECDVCLMQFSSRFTLNTHFNVLHKAENHFKCDVCSQICQSSREYINHRNAHGTKKLSSGEKLKQWLVAYEKENECNICFLKFDEVEILAAHKLTHLPQPGYKCRRCGLRNKTRHYHNLHMQTHLQERYKCKTCGAKFLYKAHLSRHEIYHSSKKYYQCDTCLILFRYKEDLEKHVTIHMS